MDYPTKNNRLLKYDESVNNVWQRTVTYTYWNTGDVSNITIHDKDDPLGANQRRDLALYYRTRGQVHLAVWGTFTVDANGDPVAGSYVPSAAREFRYHADPRARYAWRDWNTNGGSTDQTTWSAAGPLHWTDYDGAEPYVDGDITFDAQQNPAVTVGVQLFGSAGQRTAATGATRYFHADLVGSVGLRSDSAGAAAGRITYTAFGEVHSRTAGSENQRYVYCGEHGYESGLLALDGKPASAPITLQHVGARWYQAGIGRFVQRDPMALRGGVNAYAYVHARPTELIDPSGCIDEGIPPWLPGDNPFWPHQPKVGGQFGFRGPIGTIVGGTLGLRTEKRGRLGNPKVRTTNIWANAITKMWGNRIGLAFRCVAKVSGLAGALLDALFIPGDTPKRGYFDEAIWQSDAVTPEMDPLSP